MDEVIERISTLEGRVSEHDRIFDMIREEIRGLREYIDGRIDDTNTRIDDYESQYGIREVIEIFVAVQAVILRCSFLCVSILMNP